MNLLWCQSRDVRIPARRRNMGARTRSVDHIATKDPFHGCSVSETCPQWHTSDTRQYGKATQLRGRGPIWPNDSMLMEGSRPYKEQLPNSGREPAKSGAEVVRVSRKGQQGSGDGTAVTNQKRQPA